MDEKVSKESFKAYRDWQRYILKSEPKLDGIETKSGTKGRTKLVLVAYCFVMASHGTNGLNCYASDAVIAKELGLYDYRSVRLYRLEALRLGWFAWTGEKKGRSQVLDIAIPADGERGENSSREVIPAVTRPADTESPAVAEHDAWINPEDDDLRDCPACEPLLGSRSLDELRVIHTEEIKRPRRLIHSILLSVSARSIMRPRRP
jgi:hypothetical protein